MVNNIIEKIFWIQDQVKLKSWQEERLYHAKELNEFHVILSTKLDSLIRAYMSDTRKVFISESLFKIENDVDMNSVLNEIRDFMDDLKTDREGWGGAMQGLIDEILGVVEVFANTYNKV